MFPVRFPSRVCQQNETHISTQPNQAQTYPWISFPDGYQRWSPGSETSSPEETRAFESLTYPAGDVATASQSFSFSRLSRLLTPAQFQRVFNGGRRSADRYFTVLYAPNDGDASRLGFAVAKKRIHKAVGRNRIRRLARESFRYECTTLGGVDIVILAQTAAAAATNQDLGKSLQTHWARIRNGQDSSRPRRSRDKHS